jgi:hypothetical protein
VAKQTTNDINSFCGRIVTKAEGRDISKFLVNDKMRLHAARVLSIGFFCVWQTLPIVSIPIVCGIFGNCEHSPTFWLEECDGAETLIEAPIGCVFYFAVGTEDDSKTQSHLKDMYETHANLTGNTYWRSDVVICPISYSCLHGKSKIISAVLFALPK